MMLGSWNPVPLAPRLMHHHLGRESLNASTEDVQGSKEAATSIMLQLYGCELGIRS